MRAKNYRTEQSFHIKNKTFFHPATGTSSRAQERKTSGDELHDSEMLDSDILDELPVATASALKFSTAKERKSTGEELHDSEMLDSDILDELRVAATSALELDVAIAPTASSSSQTSNNVTTHTNGGTQTTWLQVEIQSQLSPRPISDAEESTALNHTSEARASPDLFEISVQNTIVDQSTAEAGCDVLSSRPTKSKEHEISQDVTKKSSKRRKISEESPTASISDISEIDAEFLHDLEEFGKSFHDKSLSNILEPSLSEIDQLQSDPLDTKSSAQGLNS